MSIRHKRLRREMETCPELANQLNDPDEVVTSVVLRGVRLEMCLMYPFRPPKLFLRGVNAKERLMRLRARIAPQLAAYRVTLPCMCCTLLCGNDNWSPNLTLVRAVEDCLQWQTTLQNLANFCRIKHKIGIDLPEQLVLNFLL
jgi:hypothetical protein